jgi:hypothetical protein
MKPFYPSHRYSRLVALAILLASVQGAFAGAFQNLDFEEASSQPAPPNYVPWDAYDPIDASAALPFWTVYEDASLATAVWGQPVALDETSVALVSVGSYDTPIQGMYSVQLYAVSWAPQGYFHTASISQTGDVPVGSRSIQFLMRSPPTAGGQVEAVPTVSLDGVTIDVFPIATNSGVITMAGDVSAFAGSTAELTFASIGPSGAPGTSGEDLFDLDAISFSPEVVPEPACYWILVIGIALLRLNNGTKVCKFNETTQVAGADRRWRWPFRYRGSRRESAVAQLL